MRMSRALVTAVVLAVCLGTAGAASAAGQVRYASPAAAFDQGLGAYKSGYFEMAIPAFTEAVEKGSDMERFFAGFYLARIYADNNGPLTDHGRAYRLFEKIVAKSLDIDPDDGRRAPFVAKAMIAVAGYLRTGLPQIGVAANVDRANDLLQDAASIYNDKDAQFELAKVHLAATAPPDDVRLGVHYLSVLTRAGHAGAQAYLADLYWRGRYVPRDELRALALVKIALRNAPVHERVWIEDIYQNIYCGASNGVRKQAEGTVATWRKVFPRPADSDEELAAAKLPALERYCKGGEPVDLGEEAVAHPLAPAKPSPGPMPAAGPSSIPPASLQGSASGFGIVGAGVKK